MARAKRVSDREIQWAALATLAERGPGLTLAEVGTKVGLSAATVLQRFGSKRDLMLSVTRMWADGAGTPLPSSGQPVANIFERLTEMSEWMSTPSSVANMTAALHLDLADSEFRELIVAGMQGQRATIITALDEAVAAGALQPCDSAQLARLLQGASHGALMSWAIEPEGELRDWVVKCVEATLAPWRVSETVVV